MSSSIQYLDLPGIFGAIQQIQGGQQRSRLLELQQQMENTKFQRGEKAYAAQQTLLDQITDPRQKLAATIAPEQFAKSIFRDPKDNYSTSEAGLWDFSSGKPAFTPNPNAGIGTAPLPGMQQPSANLQNAAPPAPQRTIPTGPAKTIEGEVPAIYQPHIEDAAKVYGVDGGVLSRMFLKETKPNGSLTSPAGARGVMQFMGPTAQQYGVDVNDPKSSIDGAGKMMGYLLQKYKGDYRLAVGAYNWGEGNVDQWIKDGGDPAKVPKETMDYVRAVVGTATAGPTDQTGFDHPGTAQPQAGGGATTPQQYPPNAVGFAYDKKTGEFRTVGKDKTLGVLVDKDNKPVGTAPLPGTPSPGGGGPFAGTSIEAQMYNTYATLDAKRQSGQALTQAEQLQYDLAVRHLMQAHVVTTANGGFAEVAPQPLPRTGGTATDTVPNPTVAPPAAPTPAAAAPPRVTQLREGTATPNNEQTLSHGYANRMSASNGIFDQLETKGWTGPGFLERNVGNLPGGNYAMSAEYQQFDQAQRDFINAQLRRESGASISPAEFENANKQYFPQPGDGPEVLAQKRAARERAISNMREASGPLNKPAANASGGDRPDPNKPQAGDRLRNPTTGAMVEFNGSAWVAVQ